MTDENKTQCKKKKVLTILVSIAFVLSILSTILSSIALYNVSSITSASTPVVIYN